MRNIHIRFFCGLLLLGIAPYVLTGGGSAVDAVLAPVDESEKVPELRRFLEQLRVAVKERNADFVQSALAPDVTLGFGPDASGVESAALSLANPDNELWQRLESSISYGGTFTGNQEGGTFCMPYVYSAFPDHLDPLEYQVVVTTPVEARSAPEHSATPVPLPKYAVVRTDLGSAVITKDSNGRQWARIYVNGGAAYVPASAIRSPLGSRTCLKKGNGQWLITAVVAGD